MAIEQEARFLIRDRSVYRAVTRLRVLGGLTRASQRRERQRNTYLDTPDLRLRRARCVLKLREVGKAAEVTFKRSLGSRGGVATRMEVSEPIRPSQKRLMVGGRLDVEPLRRARAIVGSHPLVRLFTLWTDRSRLVMAAGRHQVELDVDRVTFRKGRTVRASRLELEVENLNAPTAVFRRAVGALRRQFGHGLRVTDESKFAYGLRVSGVTARRGVRVATYV